MKLILSAFLLGSMVLFATSCGDTAAEKKDKKPKVESLVSVKDGVYTEYYPGRKAIKFQGPQTENGLRNGRWLFFSENGVEQSMTEYVEGKKEGFTFVRYPNGAMRFTGEYQQDKQIGLWKFYKEDGTIEQEKDYGPRQ